MPVKCPSCGFESAAEARWCDFCKEPFRAAKPAAEPPRPPRPQAAPAAVSPGPRPKFEKLPAPDAPGSIPAEFAHLDRGEKLPTLPPWFKWSAWAVLAFAVIGLCVLGGMLMGKKAVLENDEYSRPRGD